MRMKLDIEEKELGIDPPPLHEFHEYREGKWGGGGGNWFKLDQFFFIWDKVQGKNVEFFPLETIYPFNSGIVFRIFNYTSSTRFQGLVRLE